MLSSEPTKSIPTLGKAFIAASFNDQDEMKAELDAMVTSLEEHGYEAIVFIRENTDGMNVNQMLDAAYAKIDTCSLLVVNLTHDPRGVFLEVGYAINKPIPVLGLIREGGEISSTMAGSVTEPIRAYASADQISNILGELLEPYVLKERERRSALEKVNPKLLDYVMDSARELLGTYYKEKNVVGEVPMGVSGSGDVRRDNYLVLIIAKQFCKQMLLASDSERLQFYNYFFDNWSISHFDSFGDFSNEFEAITAYIDQVIVANFSNMDGLDELSREVRYWWWRGERIANDKPAEIHLELEALYANYKRRLESQQQLSPDIK